MQKGIIVILLSILMWGCHFFTAPGKDDCDKILSQQKMTEVMTDVYLMEGYLLDLQNRRPQIRDSAAWYYSQVFDRHGISYEVFDEALSCYLLHRPDIMAIHEAILSELSIRMGDTRTDTSVPGPDGLEASDTTLMQELPAPEPDSLEPATQLEQEAPPEELIQQEPPR